MPGAEMENLDATHHKLNRGEVGTFGLPAWYDLARNFVLRETSRQNVSPNAFKFAIRQQRLRW